ncbi:MAG: hypothetical protein KF686_16000 [Ramlibacter sp.]|nr:hypothetical protein [Ramlibacter sp.]
MATIESELTLPALQVQAQLAVAGTLHCSLQLPALGVVASLAVAPRLQARLELPPLALQAQLRGALHLNASLALPALQLQAHLGMAGSMNAVLALPALQLQSSLKVCLRARFDADYVLSVARRQRWDARWWMWTRSAARTQRALWSLSEPRRIQWYVDYLGPRRLVAWSPVWSIRMEVHWSARCGMAQIAGLWAAGWGSRAARAWGPGWACCTVVRADQAALWASVPVVRQVLALDWSAGTGLRGELALDWAALPGTRVRHQVQWSLVEGAQRYEWAAAWVASDRVRVQARHVARWMLLPDASEAVLEAAGTAVVAVDGEVLPHERISLTQSRDSGLWQLSATVLAPQPQPGSAVQVTLGGTVYALVITSVQASQQAATDGAWEVRAASAPAGWSITTLAGRDDLVAPFGGLASALAAELAAPLTLVWALPDWYIAPPVTTAQLHTLGQWAGLQALAAAAGGVVLCNPAGDELHAVPFHGPVLAGQTALEASPLIEPPEASGARVVSHSVADRIQVDGEGRDRVISVTPYPWRPVLVRVAGGAALTPVGVSIEDREEVVPIIAGMAELSDPVHQLQTVAFSGGGASELLWRAGERYVYLAEPADEVATVQYTTRVLKFTLTTASGEPVNVIVEDPTP